MAKTPEFPDLHWFDVYLFGKFQSTMAEIAATEEEAKRILHEDLYRGVGHPDYWELRYVGKGKDYESDRRDG